MNYKWLIPVCLVLAFAAIQLFPVNRSNPAVTADFQGPEPVKSVFKRSCYDCHSNETHWPWYSYLAPVSWLVAGDVHEGRDELNFSDWRNIRKPGRIAEEILEEIQEARMPLPLYLKVHPQASLTEVEIQRISDWTNTVDPLAGKRRIRRKDSSGRH